MDNNKIEPFVLWFTGLSGAGKSTLADAVTDELNRRGISRCERLDGDAIRKMFPHTGFSREDRDQHIRRIGYLAGMLERHGVCVVASFISPYRDSREFVRKSTKNFVEIFVSTPLNICEKRDPKGLYKKVRQGSIKQFTGIDDPYEIPQHPEIVIDTADKTVDSCVGEIIQYLKNAGYIAK